MHIGIFIRAIIRLKTLVLIRMTAAVYKTSLLPLFFPCVLLSFNCRIIILDNLSAQLLSTHHFCLHYTPESFNIQRELGKSLKYFLFTPSHLEANERFSWTMHSNL